MSTAVLVATLREVAVVAMRSEGLPAVGSEPVVMSQLFPNRPPELRTGATPESACPDYLSGS